MKIKGLIKVSIIGFFVLLMCSCCPQKVQIGRDVYWLPCCKEIVKYSSTMFTVKGVKIPISNVPVEIGEVTWQPEVLQTAHTITQILDMNRMATCQSLPALASAGKKPFQDGLTKMQDDETRLTALALCVAANNQDAVIKWIDAYGGRALALYAKPEISSRIKPEAIDSLKRSLSKRLAGGEPRNPEALLPLEMLWK